MAPIKTILHITPFFSPNIGGVETHLTDLINELDKQNYRNIVLTYSPLSTKTSYQATEKIGNNSLVHRFRWFGGNIFHRLEKLPLLNLLYITPYLLLRSLLFRPQKIDTIHSHGINGAIIGIFLKRIFNIKKHIVSIYSTYDNVPLNSLSTKILVKILNHTDMVLTQSDSSMVQLKKLAIKNVSRYYHWVDLNNFQPKKNNHQFSVLFVGRMIPAKNVLLLSIVAQRLPQIKFTFIGTGPDYAKIPQLKNITLLGDVKYSQLNQYYQSSSLLCVPSKYHEGWGRIIAESVACGTPVISSNLGGTIEAADKSVAIFITPTVSNFTKAIEKLYTNKKIYDQLKDNCRPYALKHYSKKNLSYITHHY